VCWGLEDGGMHVVLLLDPKVHVVLVSFYLLDPIS
jgi:hypothetical protein